MIKAGYSKNTAVAPTKMTKTKGWEELLKQYIPDKLLLKKHKLLLNKKEYLVKYNVEKKKYETIRTKEIDSQAVGKGLDLAYKLKGKNAPEEKDIRVFGLIGLLDEISGKKEEEPK